jgi:nickel-dependent lactate racemase
MTNFREEFIFYGDEVRIERFPEETRFILANPPMPPLVDFEKAVKWALDQPLKAEPLEKQLKPSSRVKIAFDDLCVPVPLMRNDVRGRVIKVLLKRLYALGIPKENIQLICANGLHRKWTLKELSLVIGKEVIQEMGPERVSCHDGTKEEELIFLGTTDSG